MWQVELERTAAPVAGGAQRALASVDVVGVKMTGDPNVPSGQVDACPLSQPLYRISSG